MTYGCELIVAPQDPLTGALVQRCGKPAKIYTDRLPPFGIALCEEHRDWGRP